MRSPVRLPWLSVLLAGTLCGCGGGMHAAPTVPQFDGSSSLAITIDVPLTGSSATTRRPAYVSAATQSLVIAVYNASQGNVGGGYLNLNANTPGCLPLGQVLQCILPVPVAITASGTYTLPTATYDQPQTQQCDPLNTGKESCAGNELSAATITQTLDVGRVNNVSLVLGGIPASFSAQPNQNSFLQGSAAGLTLVGPQAQTLTLQARDADGATIVGLGSPTVSLTSNAQSVAVTSNGSGVYTVQATTSGSPPVVTQSATALTAEAMPESQSGAQPLIVDIPLTVTHSAVFVSNGTNVLVFYDGDTTSSLTLGGVNQPRGIAVDANGTVYVADHGSATITECTAVSAWGTCANPISGPSFPEGVAIDAGGNLWVGASGSDSVLEYLAGQTSINLSLSTGLPSERGVAVDTNGNLWVADQNTSVVQEYAAPVTVSSAPAADITNGISAPIQLAADGMADLYVANCGSGCGGGVVTSVHEYTSPIGSGSSPSLTLGGTKLEGVAVDAGGTVWLADNVEGVVTQCPPPVGIAGCTSFSVPGALWIAVYPAAVTNSGSQTSAISRGKTPAGAR